MAESPKDAHGRTTSGEAAHVELDRTNFLANPVFACEALPGLPKNLSRPLEDRAVIDERTRARIREELNTTNRRIPSDSLFVNDEDDDISDDGEDYDDDLNMNNARRRRIKRSNSVSSQVDQRSKVVARVEGGRPAVPKKVTANLDDEDRIIWDMKCAGYRDDVIAKRLVDNGGTRYDPKTIATRYSRIKRALYSAEQTRLEDEFSDFHEAEDDQLIDAHEETEAWYIRELKSLNLMRWKMVGENLKHKLDKHKYSTTACRSRYEDLTLGTGIVPQELDADPVGRATAANAKVEEKVEARRAEKEKLKREKAARRAAQIEELRVRQDKFEKNERERAAKEEKRATAAAARQRIIDANRAAKAAIRQKKVEEDNETARRKAESQQRVKDRKAAQAWEAHLRKTDNTMQVLGEKERALATALADLKAEQEKLREDTIVKAIIRGAMRNAGIETTAPMAEGISLSTPTKVKSGSQPRKGKGKDMSFSDDDESVKLSPASTPSKPKISMSPLPTSVVAPRIALLAKVLAENSPRSSLSAGALRSLAKSRHVISTGSINDLVVRLAEDDAKKSMTELQDMMVARNLKKEGSKMEVARRLASYDATAPGH